MPKPKSTRRRRGDQPAAKKKKSRVGDENLHVPSSVEDESPSASPSSLPSSSSDSIPVDDARTQALLAAGEKMEPENDTVDDAKSSQPLHVGDETIFDDDDDDDDDDGSASHSYSPLDHYMNSVPDDLETNPSRYHQLLRDIHAGVLAFIERTKHVAHKYQHIYWNLPSLPWLTFRPGSKLPLGVLVLHYLTTEEARALKHLHCAEAERSSGKLRCNVWQWVRECVGDDEYKKMVKLVRTNLSTLLDVYTSQSNIFSLYMLRMCIHLHFHTRNQHVMSFQRRT